MHVVVVEWLYLKETGVDEQGNQLTAEENHDCCLRHETLTFIEFPGEKNETRRSRIENNRNVVVMVEEENNRNVLVVEKNNTNGVAVVVV